MRGLYLNRIAHQTPWSSQPRPSGGHVANVTDWNSSDLREPDRPPSGIQTGVDNSTMSGSFRQIDLAAPD